MRPRPPDICMLVENSFRSDSRVLREARSLAGHGSRVELLALLDPGTAQTEEVCGFHVRRVRVWSRGLRYRWALGLKAAEFVARLTWTAVASRARVYHAHSPVTLLPAAIAAKLRRARLVYDCHELAIALPGMTRWQSRLVRWYEGVLLRLVDRVIMSDGASRAEVFREAHGYRKHIYYVYNCPCAVEVSGCGKDMRRELGIPVAHQVMLYAGNVTDSRGLEQAIGALAVLPGSVHFVMMGQRTDREEKRLRRLAGERGVEARVRFWGPVPPDDVPLWAASADVGLVLIQNVSPSYYYSAPTKMFEMIMARVPQVASDFPEIRRVVVDNPVGPVGEVVDPADTKAIAGAILRILQEGELRSAYRRNADVLARTVYNWETQERVLLDLYGELLGGRSAGDDR